MGKKHLQGHRYHQHKLNLFLNDKMCFDCLINLWFRHSYKYSNVVQILSHAVDVLRCYDKMYCYLKYESSNFSTQDTHFDNKRIFNACTGQKNGKSKDI